MLALPLLLAQASGSTLAPLDRRVAIAVLSSDASWAKQMGLPAVTYQSLAAAQAYIENGTPMSATARATAGKWLRADAQWSGKMRVALAPIGGGVLSNGVIFSPKNRLLRIADYIDPPA